jgi:hypothetical protein
MPSNYSEHPVSAKPSASKQAGDSTQPNANHDFAHAEPAAGDSWTDRFQISPIIRITLNSLYGCLVLPLPLLAYQTDAPVSPWILLTGIGIGWIALVAALSETVWVNDQGIQVRYARWVPSFWRRGWALSWEETTALKPRSTGQGGIVYYFLSSSGQAYLLPMRIVGFARFVRLVQDRTGIDTTDVKPLSQPWMYFILFGFTIVLWLIDGWAMAQVVGGLG